MATAEELPQPTPCDVLFALSQAARDLQSWMVQIEAGATEPNPGQIINARRIGRIVQATVNQAVCDTAALARAATTPQTRRPTKPATEPKVRSSVGAHRPHPTKVIAKPKEPPSGGDPQLPATG